MSGRGWILRLAVGVLLVGIYLFRATTGAWNGFAFYRGSRLAEAGDLAEGKTLALLRLGAVGVNRYGALWLSGEIAFVLWEIAPLAGAAEPERARLLAESASDNLLAAAIAPASAWPWVGLAGFYERVERTERTRRVLDLEQIGGSPWLFVGRPGRIAVGMMRKAIAREPQVYAHHDAMASMLLTQGLRDEAMAALRRSAQVQPVHVHHAGLNWPALPDDFVAAFVEGSRESLGRVRLVTRERHLLSLAQLERRLGRLDDAERHLREALQEPADAIARAEDAFHLALVLIDRNDHEGAKPFLEQAALEPVFRMGVLSARARIAEGEGRPKEALEFLQESLRLQPRNMDLTLATARLARRMKAWRVAVDTLRWAIVLQYDDSRPRAELIETLLEAGDRAAASSALEDMRRALGESAELERLRLVVRRASNPVPGVDGSARPSASAPEAPEAPRK